MVVGIVIAVEHTFVVSLFCFSSLIVSCFAKITLGIAQFKLTNLW